MQLTVSPRPTPAGAVIELWRPKSFGEEMGPIAHELGKAYVLLCVKHRQIKGEVTHQDAYSASVNPYQWCSGCTAIVTAEKEQQKAIRQAIAARKKAVKEEARRQLVRKTLAIRKSSNRSKMERVRIEREEREARIALQRAEAAKIIAEAGMGLSKSGKGYLIKSGATCRVLGPEAPREDSPDEKEPLLG